MATQPFVWTKTADEIVGDEYGKRIDQGDAELMERVRRRLSCATCRIGANITRS